MADKEWKERFTRLETAVQLLREVVQLEGGRLKPVRIDVVTVRGKKFGIRVHHSMVIDAVKKLIQLAEGTPTDHQRLIYGGKQLEDGRTLADYNIREGDTLKMVPRLRGGMYHVTSGRNGYDPSNPWDQDCYNYKGFDFSTDFDKLNIFAISLEEIDQVLFLMEEELQDLKSHLYS
jgi:hypothetical protein